MFIEKIEKNNLLNPLQKIIGIVERKQPLPILSNVLIEKTGSNIRFVATDLEIQISTQFTDANQTSPDTAITVAAKKLQEILKVLPEESKVTLDIQETRLLVKVNKSKFTLQTLPAQDFPKVLEQLEQAVNVQIEQGKLKKPVKSLIITKCVNDAINAQNCVTLKSFIQNTFAFNLVSAYTFYQ